MIADDEDLAQTLDRKTRIATVRMPAIAPTAPPWVVRASAAAVGLCVIAAVIGAIAGHARTSVCPREARAAVVEEANEEVTFLPLSAPDKLVDENPPAAVKTHTSRRTSSFGHLGSDRGAHHPLSARH